MAYALGIEEAEFPKVSEARQTPKTENKRMPKFQKKSRNEELHILDEEETEDVELNMLPLETKGKWECIEAIIDSGSSDSVAPKGLFSPFPLKPSAGSQAGKNYVSATKHKVPNLGEEDSVQDK